MSRPTLVSETKKVAKGWRWFHPPLAPRSADLRDLPRRDFPTDWARIPAAVTARRAILGAGFRPLLGRQLERSIEGREVLEGLEQPVIFIANHSSHLDAPLILTSLPASWRDNTASGAAADYFFDVWWRAAATALAFNAFPIDRAGARRSAGMGKRLLGEGWNLLIFPEGTRSKDGLMGDFKQGAAALAIEQAAAVVPVAVRGTYQAMPRGRPWPSPGRPGVSVRFGQPLFADLNESAPELTHRMVVSLARTLEESRTTWWQALKKFEANAGGSQAAARSPLLPETREELPEEAPWRRKWESSKPLFKPDNERAWPAGR